ncbi:hypothetical protein ACQEVZ_01310 [Dactylosporangium sp. CA-152071]|uniref:hypothetical protein n=1 Tax=Dactylosporangium sp. CA-152071 TaxID=3239933 RepID=UPI003D9223A7
MLTVARSDAGWQAGAMDHEATAPVIRWWRSGLIGVGAAMPMVVTVYANAADVSAMDGVGGVLVFLVWGPMIVAGLAVAGWFAVWHVGSGKAQRRRWWWVVGAPFAMWGVLLIGALTSGPTASISEQRRGWALVVVAMYGGAAVWCATGTPRTARLLAGVVVVAAAPLMIAYDDASQHRWREATYASAPQVLPVIPGYTVVAARGDGTILEVDMRGPTLLWVSVQRCRDCSAGQEPTVDGLTFVDGGFRLWILAEDTSTGQWMPPDNIHVRSATIDELASLPLAASRDSD